MNFFFKRLSFLSRRGIQKKFEFFLKLKKKILNSFYFKSKKLQKGYFSKKLIIYTESFRRYTRAQQRNNKEVNFFLKSKYDDVKNYRLQNFSIKNRLIFLQSLKLLKNKKNKKNFKRRSRNKYFGRLNFRKYKKSQLIEMLEEARKARWLSRFKKKNKRSYVYFLIQKNSSKGILSQPKTIFKSLYNAGSWFEQSKNKITLSDVSQMRPVSFLLNFNKFVNKLFKKKTYQNFKTVNKEEIQSFLFYLDRLKRNNFWALPWQISKKFYYSNLYLNNVSTFYYNRLSFDKDALSLVRDVAVRFPINGKNYSNHNQYYYRYLKHLERTANVTNRLFTKHRSSWVKDFFSSREHLKIFKLAQKKIYYKIKLGQKQSLNKIKNNFAKILNKNKFSIYSFIFKLKYLKFSEDKKKKIILYYFKNLNYQIKLFLFLSTKNKKMNYFLKYFLKLNYCDNYFSIMFKKNGFFLKMFSSSTLIYENVKNKNVDYKIILKNKNLNKMYCSWLKFFLLRFDVFKKNNFFKSAFSFSNNLKILDNKISEVYKIRKDKPWDVLFFGKFLKYFNEKLDFALYFNIYNKNLLVKYEELADLIKILQTFIFYFFLQTKNSKKLLTTTLNLKKLYKVKTLELLNCWKIYAVKTCLRYKVDLSNSLKIYIYTYFFVNFLNFKIYRIKSNFYYRKKRYSTRFWIKNKKFLFWIEQQFEKSFKMNVKLNYISATKAVSKYCRDGFNFYFLFSKRIHIYRFFQGWRQQSIYADILWIVIIAVKYYSSSFLSNMLSEQIVKRKKQWPFIKIIRTVVREVLPKNLMENSIKVDGLRIGINGKINGRDRSTNYLIYKFYKDKQLSKIHQIYLKVDYSLSFANSKYGVFGIRVWISRI